MFQHLLWLLIIKDFVDDGVDVSNVDFIITVKHCAEGVKDEYHLIMAWGRFFNYLELLTLAKIMPNQFMLFRMVKIHRVSC